MRSDMKKVVTERPRSGGGVKTPKGERRLWQGYDVEDYPKSEKIRTKWINHYGGKNFTDVLGPLYRFLLSQVGRKWDNVYSEIAQKLPKTSVPNIHVYTHLWRFVIKDAVLIDGVVCYGPDGWFDAGAPIQSYGRYAQLYIHPRTGLLCKARMGPSPYLREMPEPCVPGIKVYPGVQYHKIRGIWYEVSVEKCRAADASSGKPDPCVGSSKDNVLERTHQDLAEMMRVYGGRYHGVSKRPLSGREIRFAGLK